MASSVSRVKALKLASQDFSEAIATSRPLLTLIGRAPAPNQMLCGAFPLRELKLETSFDKTAGNNASALEHQFRFGAQKKSTYLQHPACSRQPDA